MKTYQEVRSLVEQLVPDKGAYFTDAAVALAYAESQFNESAKGKDGDTGLFQRKDFKDDRSALLAFHDYIKRYGLAAGVGAYNAGERGMTELGRGYVAHAAAVAYNIAHPESPLTKDAFQGYRVTNNNGVAEFRLNQGSDELRSVIGCRSAAIFL